MVRGTEHIPWSGEAHTPGQERHINVNKTKSQCCKWVKGSSPRTHGTACFPLGVVGSIFKEETLWPVSAKWQVTGRREVGKNGGVHWIIVLYYSIRSHTNSWNQQMCCYTWQRGHRQCNEVRDLEIVRSGPMQSQGPCQSRQIGWSQEMQSDKGSTVMRLLALKGEEGHGPRMGEPSRSWKRQREGFWILL